MARETRSLAIGRAAERRFESLEAVELSIDVLGQQISRLVDVVESKSWDDQDADKVANALASVSTALDKVARCRNLLTDGYDARMQVDLAAVLANLSAESVKERARR